jgi:tRNA G18 (ribose-2'-O)-methylase SpoU
MGSVFLIPWTRISGDSPDYIRSLRVAGFVTAAMALRSDTVTISDPRVTEAERLAVVLGTEGDGLLGSTIEECDYTIKIPMSHGVDSLNVAAASAVAFWQLGRH